MPKTIKNAERRRVVLQLTIDIVVSLCKAYFDGKRPGESMPDALICAALVIGQAEGRPLNASKLAEFLGMARPTVIRRLSKLESEGKVERRGLMFVVRREVANSDRVISANLKASRMIARAGMILSNMDS